MGIKMASAQSQLKGVLRIVTIENPKMLKSVSGETSSASGETSSASGQASTASGQSIRDVCAAAANADAIMAEYTCVYVIFTLVKNPKFRLGSTEGAGNRASLGSVLATLAANRNTNIFEKEVDAAQAFLESAAGLTSRSS